jgi:hypothetical protein
VLKSPTHYLKKNKLKASLKDTLLKKKMALVAKAMAAEEFFLLYANLLSEDAKSVKSEQPHGLIFKGMNTRMSMEGAWSPFRIASPTTFLTCSLAMQPSSSATISAMY